MARDFEDLHDLDDLSDDELKALVKQHLASHNGLDVDDLSVRVEDGTIFLGGRVGTEGERRIAEHVVTDVLGIVSVTNEILVDPIRRAESPMDIDEHLADEERTEGLLLGDRPLQQDDEAAQHDADRTDARAFGSTDIQEVIAGGVPWIPPESPTQEGISGTDSRPEEMGEDH
jgi:hypothetical protein